MLLNSSSAGMIQPTQAAFKLIPDNLLLNNEFNENDKKQVVKLHLGIARFAIIQFGEGHEDGSYFMPEWDKFCDLVKQSMCFF